MAKLYVDLDAAASPCIIDGQAINTKDIGIDYQGVLDSITTLGVNDGSPEKQHHERNLAMSLPPPQKQSVGSEHLLPHDVHWQR